MKYKNLSSLRQSYNNCLSYRVIVRPMSTAVMDVPTLPVLTTMIIPWPQMVNIRTIIINSIMMAPMPDPCGRNIQPPHLVTMMYHQLSRLGRWEPDPWPFCLVSSPLSSWLIGTCWWDRPLVLLGFNCCDSLDTHFLNNHVNNNKKKKKEKTYFTCEVFV